MSIEIRDLDKKNPPAYKVIRFVKDGGRDGKIGAELDIRTGLITPVTEEGRPLFSKYEDLSDEEASALAQCLMACVNFEG